GVPFKPRAYEKAALALATLDRSIREIYATGGVKALSQIPSVGRGIAERIEEYLNTGHLSERDEMYHRMPVDVLRLIAVDGVGPKMVKLLHQEIGVCSVADLESAARAGKIRDLPRCGEKLEKKILAGIGFLKQATGRQPLGAVLPLVQEIEKRLRALPAVQTVCAAGSVRRRKETVGDLDLLVISAPPAALHPF